MGGRKKCKQNFLLSKNNYLFLLESIKIFIDFRGFLGVFEGSGLGRIEEDF